MWTNIRSRTRFSALLMALVLFSALLAACGSDDDDDPTATTEPPPAAAAPTQAADPTEEPAEPTDEPAEPTDEPADPTEETDPTEEPASGELETIDVDTADFAFHGIPETMEAGWVNLHFTNSGAEPHHAQFVRLNEGVTLEEFNEALQNPDPSEAMALVTLAGGPGAITNGQEVDVALELQEGTYMALCFIGGEDGIPHMAKGMMHTFEVTAGEGHSHTAPTADLKLDMHDFGFEIPEGLEAGPVTMEVVNSGEQPHELVLFKLHDGKTLEDAQAWMETEEGPPPGDEAGGLQVIGGGQSMFVTMELEAGNYMAICFIPDPETGQPHFLLGMMDEFSVE